MNRRTQAKKRLKPTTPRPDELRKEIIRKGKALMKATTRVLDAASEFGAALDDSAESLAKPENLDVLGALDGAGTILVETPISLMLAACILLNTLEPSQPRNELRSITKALDKDRRVETAIKLAALLSKTVAKKADPRRPGTTRQRVH